MPNIRKWLEFGVKTEMYKVSKATKGSYSFNLLSKRYHAPSLLLTGIAF